jgi:membrane protease YdiL (CAAX protease family)
MAPLSIPALVHLIYFGLLLPYRTWKFRNVWPAKAERRPRVEHYKAHFGSFLTHGLLSLLTLPFIPRSALAALFPVEWPGPTSLLLGVVACALMVAIDLVYSRRCFDRDAPHMYVSTPQTSQERAYWVGHSLGAGVTEELTWRGVQPALITQLTGHPWIGVVICASTFGFGHVRHGIPFIPIAAFFALIFHALTWLTGGLYVPMLVHVAVNVIVGVRAGMWLRRP